MTNATIAPAIPAEVATTIETDANAVIDAAETPAKPTNTIKVNLTRAWTDLSPKLYAFLIGGGAATSLLLALHTYLSIDLTPALANLIVLVAGGVVGYFRSDTVPLLSAPTS